MTAAAALTIPDFQTIKLEIEDGIAILTLNRPDKMNSFTAQMMLDMIAAFDITDADGWTRAFEGARAAKPEIFARK